MRKPLPSIDAEQWHRHPAWTSQAYDALIGFHDRYRRETSRLVAAAQDSAASLIDVAESCRRLEDFLHNHEAVEEKGLWPWIEERYEVSFDVLRAEHQTLNAHVAQLLAYLAGVEPSRPIVRAHLATLDRVLRAHLDAEEAICVPALLAMSPDEYARLAG